MVRVTEGRSPPHLPPQFCIGLYPDAILKSPSQARLDEDTASLGKRQASFNRDRDQMTQVEEEEYEKAVEESLFR